MNPHWSAYAIVFAVAAGTTLVATPLVRRVAFMIGAVVAPDARRVHDRRTPTLGGAAMLVGVLVAMGVAWRLGDFDDVFAATSEMVGVVLAVTVIWMVGVVDDLRDVTAPAKLAGMIVAGSILSLSGLSLLVLRIPLLDVFVLSPDLSAVLTVVWVIGMANAINLIDGLDGLAAGIVAIGAGAIFFYGIELVNEDVLEASSPGPLLAIIAAGACVGFLPHNFHPARIFMGDGGALLLGLLLAASTISVGGRTGEEFTGQTYFFFAPIFIPLFILGVPIVDTAFAIVRRASQRSSITTPDKGHLHHRLLALGHGQRRSVLILWLWTALLSVTVLVPTYTGRGVLIAVFALGGLALALYTVFAPGVRRRRHRRRVEELLEVHPAGRALTRVRATDREETAT
ncbi:MAG: MraY family glycosyltransferase [Acidimicrobiales bacterium]